MGFYGNTIYNTYGLQDKSVQPRHLDRNYWRWGRQVAVQSIQMLRKNVLNLPAIGINNFTQSNWDDCWKEAEKSVFAFHFNSNSKDNTKDYSTELRSLFGAGLNIGWVIKESKGSKSVYCLYFMALGDRDRLAINRPGSIFKLELNPNGYTEDSHLNDYANYKDSCEAGWSNKYLVGPVLSDAHLLPNSVITEKIRDLNVTEPKMADNSVSTRTIQEDAVKPSKLDRDYWERTLLGTIKTYTDLFTKCAKVSAEKNKDNIANNGTLYVCGSLQLPLPEYYTNSNDKDNYIKSSGLYDIGRCLLWYYDNTIYVISASKGQIWKIDLVSSLPSDSATQKKYYTEEGKYYLPTLNQTISPMIANSSILPNKLDRDYLEKIYISDIRGYDALFNEDNLKPISSATTSLTAENKSSSLYFLDDIFLENLPSQYTTRDNGYYISPNNQETASKDTYRYVLGRSLVWRHSDTTIYIISNTTGHTWKIDRVSRDTSGSQIVDTGNVNYKYSITLNIIPGNLIQNKSISTIKIADNAITRDKVLDGEITNSKIADDAITRDKVLDGEIIAAKIAKNQIEGGDIGHIKENTITAYNIADETITPEKFDRDYWEYDFSSSINTLSELKEFLQGDKLYRFWIPYGSELASLATGGSCIAFVKQGNGTNLGYGIINLMDHSLWNFNTSGSGSISSLNQQWYKPNTLWCYTLDVVFKTISPIGGKKPTLGVIYCSAPEIPSGYYFSYSIESGAQQITYMSNIDNFQDKFKITKLEEDQGFQIEKIFSGVDYFEQTTTFINFKLNNATYDFQALASANEIICFDGNLASTKLHNAKTVVKFMTGGREQDQPPFCLKFSNLHMPMYINEEEVKELSLPQNSYILFECQYHNGIYIGQVQIIKMSRTPGRVYTVNFIEKKFEGQNTTTGLVLQTFEILEGTTVPEFLPMDKPPYRWTGWGGIDPDYNSPFEQPITEDTDFYVYYTWVGR